MKSILLCICFFISIISYAQRIKIPDKNFEQTLIDLKIDSDKCVNGYILKSDAELITYLDISNRNIKDLSGLEAFTSLLFLFCHNNQLSSLDLKNNAGIIVLQTDVSDVLNPSGMIFNKKWF